MDLIWALVAMVTAALYGVLIGGIGRLSFSTTLVVFIAFVLSGLHLNRWFYYQRRRRLSGEVTRAHLQYLTPDLNTALVLVWVIQAAVIGLNVWLAW